ncbi:MAG: hypothetical protein ACRDK1_07655 [Solirubrobacterales bacterium]
MFLSKVTWLVIGTALVLVAAVLVAAVVLIDNGGPSFPSDGQASSGGVVRVQSHRALHRGRNGARARLAASRSGREVAAHPASTGVAALLGTRPGPGGPTPGSPPASQYDGSLQQLKSALGR